MNMRSILLGTLSYIFVFAEAHADNRQIWTNGTILTMEGDRPTTTQAVVVRNGIIEFVGDLATARIVAGNKPLIRDLRGATLLPGFVDAHSHFALGLSG